MNVTVNSDASFSNKYSRGTYAFWIVSNLGRITMAGQLRRKCSDSNDAEIKCILNALTFITQNEQLMEKSKVIYVNTDSLNAIHVFTRNKKQINAYGLRKYDHLYHKYEYLVIKLKGKKISFAHVKAHNDTDSKRSYVNDWLDKAAKEQMGLLIAKEKQLKK